MTYISLLGIHSIYGVFKTSTYFKNKVNKDTSKLKNENETNTFTMNMVVYHFQVLNTVYKFQQLYF